MQHGVQKANAIGATDVCASAAAKIDNAAQQLNFANRGSCAPTCKEVNLMPEESSRQKKNFIRNDEFDSASTSSNSCSESEGDLSDLENCEGATRAMSATISGKVTRRDIAFQEALLAAMKHQYEMSHKANKNSAKTFKVPAHYLQPASNMREISPSCGFYLPEDIIAYINVTAENASKVGETEKWRIITREVLIEVYGNTLANYSATGRRGGRPSINPMLFKGLFEWANRGAAGMLSKNQFITHINKTAANKRKYRNRKTSTKGASSSSRETGQKSSKARASITTDTHAESSPSAFNSKDQSATEELRFADKQTSRDLENPPTFKTGQEIGLVSNVWNRDGYAPCQDSTRAPHYMDSTRRFDSSDSTRISYTDSARGPYHGQHRMPAFPVTQDSGKEWMQL